MGTRGKVGVLAALSVIVSVGALVPARPAGAGAVGDLVVTTTIDELNADGDCSLREAMATVNSGIGVDACMAGSTTIVIPAGTIAFDSGELGPLVAETSMTLDGAGAGATAINETLLGTALQASAGAALTLEELSVSGGTAVRMDTGAGLLRLVDAEANAYEYGLLADDSDIELLRTRLGGTTYSSAQTTSGDITVEASTVLGDNEGTALGSTSGAVTVTDTTLSGPVVGPSVDIRRTYIQHCVECSPLPIRTGTLYLENTTIDVPLYDPAIFLTSGSATIVSSTIHSTGNLPAIAVSAGGTATVTGSIISCSSSTGLVSGGGNVTDGQCGFAAANNDVVGDPKLAPPADNGGSTKTRTLLPGSPAIDRAPTCPTSDQRGEPRPKDGTGDGIAVCDAGALELAGPPSPPPPPPPPPFTVKPVVGDWNGDGIDTPGVVDGNMWRFRNSLTSGSYDTANLLSGTSTGTPVVGDWDGDGDDNIGYVVQEPNRVRWYLQTEPDPSFQPDIVFAYGRSGTPVVGDWDGDGDDDIGIVQDYAWFLRTSLTSGVADLIGRFGTSGDLRLTGDWNGDGADTVGIVRGRTRFLKNTLAGGPADLAFNYGAATDITLVGDWDGDGIDSPGVARNTTTGIVWHLRNTNTAGPADTTLRFGP